MTSPKPLTATGRDRIAQAAAEHIVNDLMPAHDRMNTESGIAVIGEQPPRDIATIKAAILGGHVFISWMDDTVNDVMRQLHGDPTGDAAWLAGDDGA
ncbi:MAG TPA: hypothetical protein VGG75_15915 [Trebonia sp.]|jgi:hypothetical protein